MNNSRALIVISVILFISVIIVIRLINIQVIEKEKYAQLAEQQQTKIEKINAELGLIYDRNNELLVYNRNDVTCYIDLNMVKQDEIDTIAVKFGEVFGKSKEHYLSLMRKSKGTIILQRKIQPAQYEKLKVLDYKCIYYVTDPTRVYHYGSLASHVLGYVDKQHNLVSGVSEYFRKDLEGVDGYRKVYRTPAGSIVSYDENEMQPPVAGHNIFLTIDKRYQSILEEELRNGLIKFEAQSATGIIMNPNTGEILALANVEDYDPNYYWQYDNFQRRNRAITDPYDPGSTFKAFTFAALIDRDLIKMDEKIFVENGFYTFKNAKIKDEKKFSYLSTKDILVHSSNIGVAKLIQRISDDEYYKFLRSLGFGNETLVQLKGESPGKLKKPNSWSPVSKTYMSFGYEVLATPLQLITAFSSLINGGLLYPPVIVTKKISSQGELIDELKPKPIRRVISENTSSIMRKILGEAVKNGTGSQAYLNCISVGGKTGTSQKYVAGAFSKTDYNTSFIGFFPVEDPQLIILIHYNSPKIGKYGGLVAAPVFKKVAERIIEKDYIYFEKYINEQYKQRILYSDLFNEQINDKSQSNTSILKYKAPKVMPNLVNRPLSEGISELNKLGVEYKVSGSGIIVEQSISAGSYISDNEICVLKCNPIQIIGASQRKWN
jgi:cell division protein FtsI (penicillin-binding protein 3)